MANTLNSRLSIRNRLLSVLPPEEIDLLRPNLELLSFTPGDILYQAGDAIRHVYFPNTGMVSLLAVTEQGQTVEVGNTGSEGMVGLPSFLGQQEMAYQAMVQVAGDCFRVDARVIKDLFKKNGTFHDVALRYVYVIIKQISQTCVCNHFHTIEARLCRWLTVMCERSNNKQLSLTQEFLSQMLGVQRTSVGLIANSMQASGIIRYRRGKIEIVDFERLKQSACECYFIVRDEYERFLNDKNFTDMSGGGGNQQADR
jgi:CRP-like cAMP-binding protein